MAQMNDELYEVEDMDADISLKEELVEEAKNFQESSNWNQTQRDLRDLKKRWKRIHYWESDYEDQLRDEFEAALDAVYAKRGEVYKEAEAAKEDLIRRAKELAETDNLNKASKEANELMEEWKKAGHAGRETDDRLWAEFQAARDVFYQRKHDAWEQMHAEFDEAKKKKEALIVRARELKDSTEWQKTSNAMKELMDEWKSVGHAGNRVDDALWHEFNDARQEFYTRRNEHYDDLARSREENYEKKKALVEQARAVADGGVYSRENTEFMKSLSNEWKKIGFAGRERDDRVWADFRAANDVYFDGLKKMSEQRQLDWKTRMLDARNKKVELINNQKRQIERLQNDMFGLVSEATMADIQNEIDDKEDFIDELEQQIVDIDARLAEE